MIWLIDNKYQIIHIFESVKLGYCEIVLGKVLEDSKKKYEGVQYALKCWFLCHSLIPHTYLQHVFVMIP